MFLSHFLYLEFKFLGEGMFTHFVSLSSCFFLSPSPLFIYLSPCIFDPVSFSFSLSPALSLSFFLPRQQSEEAMALKASTSSKSREVSPEMMEKIIQGKVSKRMSDICLLNQVRRSSLECYKSSYTPLSGVFPFLECIGVPLSSSWTYIHLSITCSATIKNLIYPRTILGTRSGGRIACCLKVFGELW